MFYFQYSPQRATHITRYRYRGNRSIVIVKQLNVAFELFYKFLRAILNIFKRKSKLNKQKKLQKKDTHFKNTNKSVKICKV